MILIVILNNNNTVPNVIYMIESQNILHPVYTCF